MSQKYFMRSTAALLLLACAAGGGGIARAQSANGYPGPQGDTLKSLEQLPDWSGTFALDVAGHQGSGYADEPNTPQGKAVPLTPKYEYLRAHANMALQPALASCLPAGVPGVMLHTILMEFLLTPGRVTMVFEDGEVRRIYTNLAHHPDLEAFDQSYEGSSIGHWEGNTLVVDTVSFPKGALFQNDPLTTTINSHYVERIFLRDHDHMEIDATLTDPAIFTRPYTTKLTYTRRPDDMVEPECAATSRDINGTIDLTPPPE